MLRTFNLSQFWRLLKVFAINSLACVGILVLLAELYNLFAPDQVTKHGGTIAALVGACAIGYGLWRAWPRPVEEEYAKPKAKIRIVVGDLFDQDCNLVIGMTSTFDTAVPHIIGRSSIQGQFLARVYGQDVKALDNDLEVALDAYQPVNSISKAGKTLEYEIGTVAVIRHQRKHYFCVAYTQMNTENEASSTVDHVWTSLSRVWNSVRARCNGEAVAVTVLGGGLSRLSSIMPAYDAIRLTVLSYMLASRRSPVCERLDIVVQPQVADRLDMRELQSFLQSLKET